MRQLSEHYDQSPDLLSAEDFRQYCIHLKQHKKVCRQTSTQAICAFKIFWEKTLRREWPHELELARANHQFKLPVVLSASEVRRVLAAKLRPGAEWRIASDDPTYQAWVDEVMGAQDLFGLAEHHDAHPEGWPRTRYEAKALREGRAPRWWVWRRK